MTDDTKRDQLIDPAIFGSGMPDIPDYLHRVPVAPVTHIDTSASDTPTDEMTVQQIADELADNHTHQPQDDEPDYDDDGNLRAGVDHASALTPPELFHNPNITPEPVPVPVPSHTPVGHNGAPASPEEMKKDFFKDLKSYGRASGQGSAALPRLALRVIRAAADGLVSLDKPVAGSGNKDDAALIYEAYTAEDSKHAEHTSGGSKANASKLRQLIALGCMTTVDGVVVADRAVALREEMEGAELKPKPLYAGLVDVARQQIDTDTMLTDDAIREALTKTAAEKTVEKEWAKVKKTVEGLVSGENAHGLKDQSPEAVQIQELVSAYVTSFGIKDQKAKLVEALVEQGYSEDRAYEIVHGA